MLLLIIIPFVLFSLISVAYQTLFDRKFMAAAQRRLGPSVVGPKGAVQPLTDGGKLFGKQTISIKNSNSILFQLSPVILFAISLFIGTLLPVLTTVNFGTLISISQVSVTTNISLLFIILSLSLSTLTFLSAGWASFSKYSELGGIRGANQALGYELILTFNVVILVLFIRSLDVGGFLIYQNFIFQKLYFHFDLIVIFWISVLAETARVPFDLPESESELVAGYFTEYAGFLFALFFLAEYNNMIFSTFFISSLFFAGWVVVPYSFFTYFSVNYSSLFIIIFIMLILFSLHRSVLARVRIDQLYYLNWKIYMPWLSFSLFFSLFFITIFQLFPISVFFSYIQLLFIKKFWLASFIFFINKKNKINLNNKRNYSSIASLDPEVFNMIISYWRFSQMSDLDFIMYLEKFDLSPKEFFEYINSEKIKKVYWLDLNKPTVVICAFGISFGILAGFFISLGANPSNFFSLIDYIKSFF